MSEIGAETVKKLREATNVSMMECKRALVEAGGEMEKATKILREKGIATAARKASRAANQGLIAAFLADDRQVGALVEVNCETDFVARNADFAAFAQSLAKKASETDGPIADAVRDEVTARIAKTGENIVVRRNTRHTVNGNGLIGTYIHLGGKVGVLVEVGCEKPETAANETFRELVKDLTLQIAAARPAYLAPENVPPAEVAAEREIYARQVKDKPPQIVDKIVDGKLKKYFSEVCLIEQLFVKEQKQTIKGLISAMGKQIGDTIKIRRFTRYQLGE